MDYTTLPSIAALYREAGRCFGPENGFAERRGGGWRHCSCTDLAEAGYRMGAALVGQGVAPGARVGLFADSGLGWLRANFAIQMAGAVDVPRATDLNRKEMRFLVHHAEIEWLFLGSPGLVRLWEEIAPECPRVRGVTYCGAEGGAGSLGDLDSLEAEGAARGEAGRAEVDARVDARGPADLFTLIYTTGTTGEPKGVELTHGNMLSQVRNLPLAFEQGDRFLSILPVWHIYERVFETIAVSRGCRTWFTSPRTIREDLAEIRPTMIASAPRLWESLHNSLLRGVEKRGKVPALLLRAGLATRRAVREAREVLTGNRERLAPGREPGRAAGLLLRGALAWLPARLLDAIFLRKVRAICGGCLRGTVSGGGALPPEVDRFFNDLGIPILEGYGLTETSPVLAVRRFEHRVLGTVGPLWPETELRIVDPESGALLYPDPQAPGEGRGRKGEVVVRGPQVMRGYHHEPGKTAAVLDADGWFRTGDLGLMTYNDCLKIVGRWKETIVLRNGENVEPQPLENRLLESRWIDQVMIAGQDERFLVALIVPSLEEARLAGCEVESLTTCAADPQVRAQVAAEVDRHLARAVGIRPFERVQRFHLLAEPFRVGEELTRTYKMRRRVIAERYAGELRALYEA